MLLQLATALTEKPLPAFNKRPIQQAQKLENVQIALNLIKSDGLNINVDTKGTKQSSALSKLIAVSFLDFRCCRGRFQNNLGIVLVDDQTVSVGIGCQYQFRFFAR